jgi:aminoglycoside phosphotransferase family enzyme
MLKIVLAFAHQIGFIDTLIDFAYFMLDIVIKFLEDLIERFF